MGQPSASELREMVLDVLGPKLDAFNLDRRRIDDCFHFLDSGIMDSFGVIELVTQVQEKASLEIDFSDFDPQEFLTLGGLVNAILRNSGS